MSSHIPPWATKVVDASGKYDASTFVTSTQQSANLFRIECARIWQQRIHRAQRKAWAKTVQTLLDHKAQQKSNTIESTTPQLAHYSLSPCDPSENDGFETEQEFLSMTIVSPPPTCRLDRQALAEALWDLYQGSRCCSLLLPRLLPTLHSTLHLLTRQCLHTPMHNDPEFYAQSTRFFRKHQKKRHASMQQLLLWWAARTKAFDSMVIVLEVIHLFWMLVAWIVSINIGSHFDNIITGSRRICGIKSSERLYCNHSWMATRPWVACFLGHCRPCDCPR